DARNIAGAEHLLQACPPELRQWEWHYLKRLCHGESKTFTGHQGDVYSVTFHPQDGRLASGSWDGSVRIWDPKTGQACLVLTERGAGHQNSLVVAVTYSSDGRLLASASQDGTVQVCEANTGRLLHILGGTSVKSPLLAFDASFSPDCKRLAVAYGDSPLQ